MSDASITESEFVLSSFFSYVLYVCSRQLEESTRSALLYNEGVDSLAEQVTSLRSELEQQRWRVSDAQRELTETQEGSAELEKLVSELRDQLADVVSLKFSVEEELAGASIRLKELQEELDLANSRSKRSVSEAARAKKELDVALRELQSSSESVAALRSAQERAEASVAELRASLTAVSEQLASSRAQCETLESELVELKCEHAESTGRMLTLAAEREVSGAVISGLRAKIAVLEETAAAHSDRVVQLTRACNEAQDRASRLEVAYHTARCDVEMIEAKDAEISALNKKLVEVLEIINIQQTTLEEAEKREIEFAEKRLKLQKIAVDADAQAKELSLKVIDLTQMLGKSQSDLMQVTSQLKDKKNELSALKNAVTAMISSGDGIDVGATKADGQTSNRDGSSPSREGEGPSSPHDASVRLQLQKRWRDDLWSQGLDLQSAMSDVASITDAIAPLIASIGKSDSIGAAPVAAPSAGAVSSTPKTRMRKVMEKRQSDSVLPAEIDGSSLSAAVQVVMERMHEFHSTLLSPPWEDKTIEEATTEIINAHIVDLKPVVLHSSKPSVSSNGGIPKAVVKVLLKWLMRIMRKRNGRRVGLDTRADTYTGSRQHYESPLRGVGIMTTSVSPGIESHIGMYRSNVEQLNDSIVSSMWDVSTDSIGDHFEEN